MGEKRNSNNEKENKTGSYTQTGESERTSGGMPGQGAKTKGGLSPESRQNTTAMDDADQPRRRRKK